jgi:hypothetical protein
MDLPRFTPDDYEKVFADRHLLHGVVAKWAGERPAAPAILSAEGSRQVTWSEFHRFTTALAGELSGHVVAHVRRSHSARI